MKQLGWVVFNPGPREIWERVSELSGEVVATRTADVDGINQLGKHVRDRDSAGVQKAHNICREKAGEHLHQHEEVADEAVVCKAARSVRLYRLLETFRFQRSSQNRQIWICILKRSPGVLVLLGRPYRVLNHKREFSIAWSNWRASTGRCCE